MSSHIKDVLTHIEASAPCSMFSVALWVQDQLDLSTVGFLSVIDTLVTLGKIEVSSNDSGLAIDLL